LVLTESILARRFSHAPAGGNHSLTSQVLQTVIRLRSGNKQDGPSGRAA